MMSAGRVKKSALLQLTVKLARKHRFGDDRHVEYALRRRAADGEKLQRVSNCRKRTVCWLGTVVRGRAANTGQVMAWLRPI